MYKRFAFAVIRSQRPAAMQLILVHDRNAMHTSPPEANPPFWPITLTMKSVNSTITQAIRERRLLSFIYDDLPRIIEPHAYGTTANSSEVLRAYQTGGQSSSGKIEGWKLITVEKIVGLRLCEETFPAPREGYKQGDKAMLIIHAEL